MRSAWALSAGIALGVFALPCPASAQTATRFALEVTPGARCVSRASLVGYLQALFGGDPLAGAAPTTDTVVIDVRGRELLSVELRLRRGPDAPAERLQRLRERAARCEQLLASVASVLHEHLAPPPAPPAPPPPSPPSAPSTSTVRVETLRNVVVREAPPTQSVSVSSEPPVAAPRGDEAAGRRLGVRIALEGYGAWGVLPAWSGGLRLSASVRLGRPDRLGLAIGVGGRFDFPVTAGFDAGSLETRALGGDLLVCARWRALDACALAHLGVSSSQLVNGADGAETTSRWAIGAQVGGTIRVAGPFGLRASAEALTVPQRTTQRIGDAVVWTSPWIGLTAGLGLVLDFL